MSQWRHILPSCILSATYASSPLRLMRHSMSKIKKLCFSLIWSIDLFTPCDSKLQKRQILRLSRVVFTWCSSEISSMSKGSLCWLWFSDLWRSDRISPFEDDSCYIDLKILDGSASGWASRYSFSNFLCFFDFLWSSSISIVLNDLPQGLHFQLVVTETLRFELASTIKIDVIPEYLCAYMLSFVQKLPQKWAQALQFTSLYCRRETQLACVVCSLGHLGTLVCNQNK